MNPAWFLVGLQIGDRLAPVVRPHAKRLIRETYWRLEGRMPSVAGRLAYRRWVRSLP